MLYLILAAVLATLFIAPLIRLIICFARMVFSMKLFHLIRLIIIIILIIVLVRL